MNIFSKAVKLEHKLNLPNPFVVDYHYFPKSISDVQADMHYDMQLGIVLSGGLDVSYPDFKTSLSAGQVWWSFCWEPHACRPACDNTGHLVISLIVEALGNIDPFAQFPWLLPFSLSHPRRPQATTKDMQEKIFLIGRNIQKINLDRGCAWQTLLWMKIHELIIILCRDKKEFQSPKQFPANSISRIIPALQLVKSDLTKPVFVENAARACGMSVSRFSEVFPDIMGITFGKFALQARLAGATKTLKTTNHPIKAIAREWGFANASHFHNVFKQYFHCTPAEYRK